MADKTRIEWTDATWNPITGCSLVSEGCRNCYAAELAATRLKDHPSRAGLARRNAEGVAKFTGEVRFNEGWLLQPLHWRKPRRIFVCAHGDLFHEAVPDAWIDQVFAVMALAPQHTFQVLTKRPERMRDYLTRGAGGDLPDVLNHLAFRVTCVVMSKWCPTWTSEGIDGIHRQRAIQSFSVWPLPNVWLGTSIEDQPTADARIPALLETPAAMRFVSAEPLLGPVRLDALRPVNFAYELDALDPENNDDSFYQDVKIDWVIAGGESGRGARPMHPDWVRSLRNQCSLAEVPFFFMQWGEFAELPAGRPVIASKSSGVPLVAWPDGTIADGTNQEHGGDGVQLYRATKQIAGALLDGVEHREFPE